MSSTKKATLEQNKPLPDFTTQLFHIQRQLKTSTVYWLPNCMAWWRQCCVDGRHTVAGEPKETGQRPLTKHTSALYQYRHTVVWLRVEHWAYWRPQLVVTEW